jgi:WD repeat and SOF domain-containing protein 1
MRHSCLNRHLVKVNREPMKIKTISRTEEDYLRKTTHDINKVQRNRDPSVHPFEKEREYTRALTAVKLDRIFAKPFVGALDGHRDGIHCMSSIRSNIVPFISGACDGELRVWDLQTRKTAWNTIAHTGFVRGIAPDISGFTFFTCGDDKIIKHWSLQPSDTEKIEPIALFQSAGALTAIDHHWVDPQFATSGDALSVWDPTRANPIHTFQWGAHSILSVKYNPAEASLLASTGNDRSICLYDLRASVPMRKFMLPMNSNKIAWNPREPMNFVVANEDYNCYTFDMRNLSKALMIHKDHVSAVMDIAFSPTGREFVSGGYDRTIRIFGSSSGRSREVYHTKRMQRVFSVGFTSDAEYVLSGSDDTNIRIWKAQASESIGVDASRSERKKNYLNSLKKRYSHMPEIRRIAQDKKLPKGIKKAKAIMHIQKESEHRKIENRMNNSKAGVVTVAPEKERKIVKEFH